jgi:CO/xanthine dehydrogenase FAD-binding subunit
VQSEGPSQALVLAERLVDNERLNADCVEVMHVANTHLIGKPPSSDNVARAASLASKQAEYLADHYASADYRKHLVKTEAERAPASRSAT